MTRPTWRLSARATRPDKRSCSWRSAAARARCTCSSAARWGPACRSTWRAGSGQPPTWSSMNRPRSTRSAEIIVSSEIVLRNNATALQSRLPCAAVFVFIGAEPAADWLPAGLARDANGYLLTGSDVVRSGLMAQSGSRPVSPGDDRPRRAGRRRHPLRVHQARRIRRRRRLAGGYLRPSLAVDRPLSSAGCRFQGSASTAWRCFKLSAACDSVPHSADNTPW